MTWEDDGAGVLELPSGRRVRGRRMSASFDEDPEFGVYALLRPPHVPWPHRWVRWPDFGLPVDDKQARDALAEAWGRAVTARVEVACGGGRGRTGTMLAALAMLDGLHRDAAIAWVRERYDARGRDAVAAMVARSLTARWCGRRAPLPGLPIASLNHIKRHSFAAG